MATQKETVRFILSKLGNPLMFNTRAMFGEYALYANGKVVALICDDMLYVKITSASQDLESQCEKGPPYPGAKPHYIVEETQLSTIEGFSSILLRIAESLPAKRQKVDKK